MTKLGWTSGKAFSAARSLSTSVTLYTVQFAMASRDSTFSTPHIKASTPTTGKLFLTRWSWSLVSLLHVYMGTSASRSYTTTLGETFFASLLSKARRASGSGWLPFQYTGCWLLSLAPLSRKWLCSLPSLQQYVFCSSATHSLQY